MGVLLSCMFQLTRGIRQGGVLSPYLFALYVDDVMAIVEKRLFLSVNVCEYCYVRR